MEQAIAYSTLFLTVGLAVSRPRIGLRGLRFTPGTAALLGVSLLCAVRLLSLDDVLASAELQWRPMVAIVSIMIMTGAVAEVGAFNRLAVRLERYARRASPMRVFTVIFLAGVLTPTLLTNDATILLLTPLVAELGRRVYKDYPGAVEAFAFAIFLAPGVAPFIVSNPMNLILAEYAGLGFNSYALAMVPLSIAGAILTYFVMRWIFRRQLEGARATPGLSHARPRHPGELPILCLVGLVLIAYPIGSAFGAPVWGVALAGAVASLVLAQALAVATPRRLFSHVSFDILIFLWGVFLVVVGLRNVGLTDRLASVYQLFPSGSSAHLWLVGITSAIGSAVVDNHPMSVVNLLALGPHHPTRPLLAALIGGDIGPRLLPVGSLAGLLWMELLRKGGVQVSVRRFIRVGTLVVIPTLALSLGLLVLR